MARLRSQHLTAGLVLVAMAVGFKFGPRGVGCLVQRRAAAVGRMRMSGGDEQQPGLLKSVVVGGILLGVFGTSLGSVRDVVSDVVAPPQAKVVKKGESGERGALTRLTRREISSKLAQVPVFFGTPSSGGGGISGGKIFIALRDAEAFVKESQGLKLGAATLEDVYYPLILKKAKIIPGMGVASDSDPAADYTLLPPSSQTADGLGENLGKDVPVFRVANLAFQRNGIEIPLFIFKADALSTLERLQQQEGVTKPSEIDPPPVQVTSIARIVALWESGGVEGRSLEIYPGDDEVQMGRKLLGEAE